MGGLRRRMGEGDGTVEGGARLLVAAELHQEGALDPEEMEVAGERLSLGLDHLEPGRGAARACWRSRSAVSPMISGSAGKRRSRSRARRIASSQSAARIWALPPLAE